MSAAAAEPEPSLTHSEQDLLDFVRDSAARYDPWRSLTYATVSPARAKHAAAVAQRLLRAHLRYLQHTPLGRGRRQHSAEVHAILEGTNSTTLVLALAILDLAFAALPPGTRD